MIKDHINVAQRNMLLTNLSSHPSYDLQSLVVPYE
jgi:hypothetical protein